MFSIVNGVAPFSTCPIDVNVNVKDCGWWNSEKCYKCLFENAQHVKITR